jgi:sugar lactone lactonase YvrE
MLARALVLIVVCLVSASLVHAQSTCPITSDGTLASTGLSVPRGVAVDPSGYLYVVDQEICRVQKLGRDGQYFTEWGTSGTGQGQFRSPMGIAISSDYRIYVVDQSLNRVQEFDTLGIYKGEWGASGENDGQFSAPVGIAVDGNGNVYVTDTVNQRVQKFDRDGNFITKWGQFGSNAGEFYNPWGIAVDASGRVYVADKLNFRIQRFDGSGNFIDSWGTFGSQAGQVRLPSGLALDAFGGVYVADWENFRVSKFTGDGQFLTACNPSGNPEWVAVDTDGNVFVTAEGYSVVQKFVGAAASRSVQTAARAYMGVSFPLVGQGASVDAVLTPQLGPRDDTKWRLGHWDPIAGNYVSAESGSITNLTAGTGYWLITDTPKSVRTTGCAEPDSEVLISLPGPAGSWHQVGNPYPTPVPASLLAVRTTLGRRLLGDPFNAWTSTNVWVYDGTPYDPNPEKIPGQSMFWVQKTTGIPVEVIVPRPDVGPFQSFASSQPHFGSTAPRGRGLWEIEITAIQEKYRSSVTVGATEGMEDQMGIALPPSPPGPHLRLAVQSREQGTLGWDYLSLFQQSSDVITWNLRVDGPGERGLVTFEVQTRGLPQGAHVSLSDPRTASRWNVSPDNPITIVAPGGGRDLRLTVDRDTEIAAPSRATFRAYPNPSRGTTGLIFTRSAGGPVRANIYDITGRRVASLHLDDAPQGEVLVPWNGRDDKGNEVGSGIFFAQCSAGKQSGTVRIVRLR